MAVIELVTYNPDKMIAASRTVIGEYAKFYGTEQAGLSDQVLNSISGTIRDHRQESSLWNPPGIEVIFSGIPPILPRIIEGRLEHSAPNPYYLLIEGEDFYLLPTEKRIQLARTTYKIVEEMEGAFKLDVNWKPPVWQLTFPKEEYADRIDRVEVPLLGNDQTRT